MNKVISFLGIVRNDLFVEEDMEGMALMYLDNTERLSRDVLWDDMLMSLRGHFRPVSEVFEDWDE